VFLDETCREIAVAGTIQGTVTTQTYTQISLQGRFVNFPNAGNSRDPFLRFIKIVNETAKKEHTLVHESVISQMYTPNPGVPEGISEYFSTTTLGSGNPTYTSFISYPPVPAGTVLTLHKSVNWFQQLKALSLLVDTADFVIPAHLLILGTYEKALKEVYGSDDPKAQDARAAFLGALGSELSQDGQLEGSGVEQWDPV
jgi:hypothetical protein